MSTINLRLSWAVPPPCSAWPQLLKEVIVRLFWIPEGTYQENHAWGWFQESLRAGGLGSWTEGKWRSRRQRNRHTSELLGATVVLPDPVEIWNGLASLIGVAGGRDWEMGWWWGVWRSPRWADTLFWYRNLHNKQTNLFIIFWNSRSVKLEKLFSKGYYFSFFSFWPQSL